MDHLQAFDILYRSVKKRYQHWTHPPEERHEDQATRVSPTPLALCVALASMIDLSGSYRPEEMLPHARKMEVAHFRAMCRMLGLR